MAALRRGDVNEADLVDRLERELQAALESNEGVLGSLRRASQLDRDEVLIVLLLLKRLLADSGPGLKGKRILRFLFSSTYCVLRGTRYLDGDAPLRAWGIVECIDSDHSILSGSVSGESTGTDVLESEFRLSATFFERVCAELAPKRTGHETGSETGAAQDPGAAAASSAGRNPALLKPSATSATRSESAKGYRDNIEYVLDLKHLASLHRRRSDALFRSDDLDSSGSRSHVAIQEAIDRKIRSIRESLLASARGTEFAAAEFQAKHRLSDDEMVIVITLLFQEIHTGNPYTDAVDLLKLACRSERELIERRPLLSERGSLLRSEILIFEDPSSSPEFAGETCLAPWALEAILGRDREREAIDSDLRLDFHEYIQNIHDSHDFFAKLRLPPQRDV